MAIGDKFKTRSPRWSPSDVYVKKIPPAFPLETRFHSSVSISSTTLLSRYIVSSKGDVAVRRNNVWPTKCSAAIWKIQGEEEGEEFSLSLSLLCWKPAFENPLIDRKLFWSIECVDRIEGWPSIFGQHWSSQNRFLLFARRSPHTRKRSLISRGQSTGNPLLGW